MAERFALFDYAYAHRGFWAKDGPPENSLEAFRAAADAGLGIELDVRPAADGTPVCFHDPFLDRMASASGLVSNHSSTELQTFKLPNGEALPLFSDLLDMWPPALPMLVEMKIDGTTDPKVFAETVAQMVDAHTGKAALMSFSEAAVSAIPGDLMRGQLIVPSSMIGKEKFERSAERAIQNSVDYVAIHVSDATLARIPLETVCWTVTEQEERDTVRSLGLAEIFEHLPAPLAAH